MLSSIILSLALYGGFTETADYWKGYASVLIAEEILEKKEADIHKLVSPPTPKPKEPQGSSSIVIPQLNINIPVPEVPSNEPKEEEPACQSCQGGGRIRIGGRGFW